MKRLTIVMFMVLALALGASAEMKPALYIGGGLGMPMSPDEFKDFWKMGFNVNGGIGFAFSPNVELIGKVAYNTFPLNADDMLALMEEEFGPAPEGTELSGGSLNALEFGADIKYIFGSDEEAPFSPFLIAGGGFTSLSFSDITISVPGEAEDSMPADASTTEMSLNIGAGFEYALSPKMGLFVDGRYVIIMTEGESSAFFPIHVGLKIALGGE